MYSQRASNNYPRDPDVYDPHFNRHHFNQYTPYTNRTYHEEDRDLLYKKDFSMPPSFYHTYPGSNLDACLSEIRSRSDYYPPENRYLSASQTYDYSTAPSLHSMDEDRSNLSPYSDPYVFQYMNRKDPRTFQRTFPSYENTNRMNSSVQYYRRNPNYTQYSSTCTFPSILDPKYSSSSTFSRMDLEPQEWNQERPVDYFSSTSQFYPFQTHESMKEVQSNTFDYGAHKTTVDPTFSLSTESSMTEPLSSCCLTPKYSRIHQNDSLLFTPPPSSPRSLRTSHEVVIEQMTSSSSSSVTSSDESKKEEVTILSVMKDSDHEQEKKKKMKIQSISALKEMVLKNKPKKENKITSLNMIPLTESELMEDQQSKRRKEDKELVVNMTNIESHKETRTTIMICNIPNSFTQQTVLKIINSYISNQYDFFYLPIDFRTQCNLGYAYLNCCSISVVKTLFLAFDHKHWPNSPSKKICKICFARIQGKMHMLNHSKEWAVMHLPPQYRPLFFEPSMECVEGKEKIVMKPMIPSLEDDC